MDLRLAADNPPPKPDRAEIILDVIYDEVRFKLNPNDDECWNCGGEGETYDCIDGCCLDAESGCPDCSRPCVECRIHAANVKRAVRLEVLRSLDIDLARAWLKRERRWKASITPKIILLNLHCGRVACDAFTADERAESACWVEGLF